MSGKKHYRTAKIVLNRIKEEAENKAAEARREAEREQKLKEEQLRLEEKEREKERNRLQKLAEQAARKKEEDRQRTLASECDSILKFCEAEISVAQAKCDSHFSMNAITQTVQEIRSLIEKQSSIDLVRQVENTFKQLLASFLDSVSKFKTSASECDSAITITKTNKDVRNFFGEESKVLVKNYESIVHPNNLMHAGPSGAIEALKDICNEASNLLIRACQLSAEYDSRNKLLQATIASLKSMGFYVDDPAFLNERDPCGPVTLCANRGGDRIVINIPVSGEIESTWQGILDSKCISDFHAFLAKLDDAGFPCVANNPNPTPPELIQKGAKTLPRNTGESKGR